MHAESLPQQPSICRPSLKVLLLAPLVDVGRPGGDSVHVTKVATLLASQHCCFVSLVSKQSKQPGIMSENIEIIRVPRIALLGMATALVKGLRASRRTKYDVILERGSHMSPGLLISKLRGIPLVLEANGFSSEYYMFKSRLHKFLVPVIQAMESKVYRSAELVIATSLSVANYIEKRLNVPRSRVVEIHNGADVLVLSPSSDKVCERNKKRTMFCFVGTFQKWQDLETILEAFKISPRIRATASVNLVGDGPLMGRIRKTIAKRGLSDCFYLSGLVPHDQALAAIASADACLAPLDGRKSAAPLKVFEYMALGKPIIASRTVDHLFIEQEGIGLLFEPGDGEDLARCIESFIDRQEELTNRAKRGIELVRDRYNWGRTVDKLFEVLSGLANKNSSVA